MNMTLQGKARTLLLVLIVVLCLTGCTSRSNGDDKLVINMVYDIQSRFVDIALKANDYLRAYAGDSIDAKDLVNKTVILKGQLNYQRKLIKPKNTGSYSRELLELSDRVGDLLDYSKEVAKNGAAEKERVEGLLKRIVEQNNRITEKLQTGSR
jgi:hypothetical protein